MKNMAVRGLLNVKAKGKHLVLFFVFMVTGFIVAFSYQLTEKEQRTSRMLENQWEKENELRNEIIKEQKINDELFEQLQEIQESVQDIERVQAEQEQLAYNLVEDLENLRMITGNVKVKGPGIVVSLDDASYIPEEDNPNNYIVHEGHIQKVVQELYITGAEAIAINGQRISQYTHILCIGPVVEVDGNQYFAPFDISAIGDPDMMVEALNLKGNIKDQLVQEGIEVTIEKKSEIVMEPFLSKEG